MALLKIQQQKLLQKEAIPGAALLTEVEPAPELISPRRSTLTSSFHLYFIIRRRQFSEISTLPYSQFETLKQKFLCGDVHLFAPVPL